MTTNGRCQIRPSTGGERWSVGGYPSFFFYQHMALLLFINQVKCVISTQYLKNIPQHFKESKNMWKS